MQKIMPPLQTPLFLAIAVGMGGSSQDSENFDIDALESEIESNPDGYRASFIINYGYGLPESKKNEALHDFINFVGPANVLSFQFIQGPYILLTMRTVDHMHELLSSVVQLEITLSDSSKCVLNLFPVVPVRAQVKILITGIPCNIINRNMHALRAQIGEMFLHLLDITVTREVDGLIPTGNIFFRATTNDLKKLYQELQSNVHLLCEGYNGEAKFLESAPVGGPLYFNLESTPGVRVYPWI